MGAQTSGDPNHPTEVIKGSEDYRSWQKMLEAKGVQFYPQDKISAFPDPALGLGSMITIERSAPVSVKDGNATIIYRTWAKTVNELLAEKMIDLGEKDVINPGVDTKISKDMMIVITRVNETDVKEVITLPFKTITKDDPDLLKGKQRVETKGENGMKERVYHVRRENGKLVSRVLTSEKVTKQVIDQIVYKGTKVLTEPVSSGVASWYIKSESMIGACNLVPRGTKLKVTNLANGKAIEVTASGGGLRSDRVIDLSTAAFKALGASLGQGTISRVKVEKILN